MARSIRLIALTAAIILPVGFFSGCGPVPSSSNKDKMESKMDGKDKMDGKK